MNAMYNRQTIWVLVVIIVVVAGCRIPDTENLVFRTISNPLNLNYRFCLNDVSRRDAANPCIIQFEDGYYLFLFGSVRYALHGIRVCYSKFRHRSGISIVPSCLLYCFSLSSLDSLQLFFKG